MGIKNFRFWTGALVLCALITFTPNLYADGKVIAVEGSAKLMLEGQRAEGGKPLQYGAVVKQGDLIVTGPASKVRILFDDRSIITIAENSQLKITTQKYDKRKKSRSTKLNLFRGKLRSLVPKISSILESNFEVETPNAVAGVRGTYFLASYVRGVSRIVTLSGTVAVRTPQVGGAPAGGGDNGRPGGGPGDGGPSGQGQSREVLLNAGSSIQAGEQGFTGGPSQLTPEQIEAESGDTEMGEPEPEGPDFVKQVANGGWQPPPPPPLAPLAGGPAPGNDPFGSFLGATPDTLLPPPISQELEGGNDQFSTSPVDINVDTSNVQ